MCTDIYINIIYIYIHIHIYIYIYIYIGLRIHPLGRYSSWTRRLDFKGWVWLSRFFLSHLGCQGAAVGVEHRDAGRLLALKRENKIGWCCIITVGASARAWAIPQADVYVSRIGHRRGGTHKGQTHTEGAHTEGARHTEGATHTRGATHTGDTQTDVVLYVIMWKGQKGVFPTGPPSAGRLLALKKGKKLLQYGCRGKSTINKRRWHCFSALRSAVVVWVVWYEICTL